MEYLKMDGLGRYPYYLVSIYQQLLTLLFTIPAHFSGNEFNKMHLWQNLGTGQNGKTQEVNRKFLP